MKLNVGCGSKPKKDYINIDIVNKSVDIIAKSDQLPFDENTVDVIESYHLIEHMDKLDAFNTLQHWYSLLKPKGKLIIECPDIEVIMKKYLSGDEEMLYSVYGRNRYNYDNHLWGYSRNSIRRTLLDIGYKGTRVMDGTDYHSKSEPCMRVEAIK